MTQIIPNDTAACKNYFSFLDASTHNRSFLDTNMFKQANELKRAWIKAACMECKLSGNKPKVLETLAFLTDPIHGIGSPAISTIQHTMMANGHDISYKTVSRILNQLKDAGILDIEEGKFNGHKKNPNTYKLRGFEYKLANHSPKMSDNLNNTNLQDLNTNLPLKDERINISNLQDALQEYEQFDAQLRKRNRKKYDEIENKGDEIENKIEKSKNHDINELLTEITESLSNDIAQRVIKQTKTYMLKTKIQYPRAFIEHIAKREKANKYAQYAQHKDDQEIYRQQALRRIAETKRLLETN